MWFDYSIERGQKSIGKTSSEIKNRWNANTYKRYTVSLRKDEDAELINFVEQAKQNDEKIITRIFRAGVEKIKNEGI